MADVAEKVQIERGSAAAIERIKEGKITDLDALIAFLAPEPQKLPVPAKPPLPAAITPAQQTAIERIPEVFGKVVPAEVRQLSVEEVTQLLDERAVLSQVADMAKKRMENIRTTVFNHNDKIIEETLSEDERAAFFRDKDGHYVIKTEVTGDPECDTQFSITKVGGKPSFVPSRLERLADDPADPRIDHEDWLAVTTPVRVFDQAKAMIHLRKKPSLLEVFAEATEAGEPSLQLRQPKAKG